MIKDDPFCPPGHQFLFQCTDAQTEQEAREEIAKVFGHWKPAALKAKLVRGQLIHHRDTPTQVVRFEIQDRIGYRAYLPRLS